MVFNKERAKEAGKRSGEERRRKVQETALPARAGGDLAAGPSLIAQKHGGAVLSGGIPSHPGTNHHMVRERAREVRGRLLGQLEGGAPAAKDLKAILETARKSDGRLRCKACGSFIPGVSKLKLGDILAVIRELRAVLPAQLEHEGLPPIQVNVVSGVQVVPYRPDEQ